MARLLSINWQRIVVSDTIRRSSQVLAVGNDTVHIFGGEIVPREPVDSNVYSIPLNRKGNSMSVSKGLKTQQHLVSDLEESSITTQPASSSSPSPRRLR
jgi:hypothetical protein